MKLGIKAFPRSNRVSDGKVMKKKKKVMHVKNFCFLYWAVALLTFSLPPPSFDLKVPS